MNATLPRILAHGYELNATEDSFGELRRSDDVMTDMAALRGRFAEDGYLYVPGFLDRAEVHTVREHVAETLAQKGLLDPAYPVIDMVKKEGADMGFLADPWHAMEYMNSIAKQNKAMQRLLYTGRIIRLFEGFFEDKVRHFDFTWVRTMGKGFGTDSHCDNVYMSRGSSRLCTLWVPYGDISYEIGGLMILEGSHRQDQVLKNYLNRDVDKYCENRPEAEKIKSGEIPWTWGGVLSSNPCTLRANLGGRWLSAEYRMGDILIFGMKTVHASLDNQTPYFRLSTDSRYQPASDPIDERWIGEHPVGHGRGAKKPMIC
ncbi:MAG: phytanoyl-CoA dioxygenase family protein [Opitutaceae bacterium]|nr:phytanoyl-CoA dioxygenase family protein [Opitutaceae bacterium]